MALLAVIPALLAAGLGVLYAAGAIDVYGQFTAADIPVSDYLPLVPLEQMLGRGIAALVVPLAAGVVFAAIAFVSAWGLSGASDDSQRSGKDAPEASDAESTERKGLRSVPRWLPIVGIGCIVLFLPLPLVLGLVISVAFAVVAVLVMWKPIERRFQDWRFTAAWTIGTLVASFVAVFAQAFLDPRPLPTSTLELADGSTLQGDVIVEGPTTFYLKISDQTILEVDVDRIEQSTLPIEERVDDPDPSLAERVRNLFR